MKYKSNQKNTTKIFEELPQTQTPGLDGFIDEFFKTFKNK